MFAFALQSMAVLLVLRCSREQWASGLRSEAGSAKPKLPSLESSLFLEIFRAHVRSVGYEVQAKIVREKIARLKALRLAKEASERARLKGWRAFD
jgi:hypothetical protein